MKKQTTNIATKTIAPTTLGRIRSDVERIKQIKDIKNTEDAVNNFLELQAKMFGLTLTDLKGQLDAMKKPSVQGVREAERAHRLNLANSLATFLGLLNKWKLDGYKNLDSKKLAKAYEDMSKLHSHEVGVSLRRDSGGRRELFSSMSILWTPFQTADGKPNIKNLMAVYCGGWSDGSKEDTDQYFSRFVPITKRTGYRKDSIAMTIPIAGQVAKAEKPAKKQKKAKAEKTAPPAENKTPEQPATESEQSTEQPAQ